MREQVPLITRMQQQSDAWEKVGDPRAVFLSCYRMMTGNMLSALAEGRFSDPDWVDALLHRFATYYFDALEKYERGDPDTPAVWQQAHQASCVQDMHVLQHLFLGINAHINYDLALALYDGLHADWPAMDAESRARRVADHRMVNQIIAETIDAVQDQVIEPRAPAMELIDRLMGRMDEWLLSELISSWREEVWQAAESMLEAADAARIEASRLVLERAVLRRGETLARL